MEIHILVHICVLETLASEAGGEEEVRLNIYVEPAVFVIRHAPVEILLILACLFSLRKEVVHALMSSLCGQLMEFFESDCF